MSVLIKGLKMPKDQDVVCLMIYPDGACYTAHETHTVYKAEEDTTKDELLVELAGYQREAIKVMALEHDNKNLKEQIEDLKKANQERVWQFEMKIKLQARKLADQEVKDIRKENRKLRKILYKFNDCKYALNDFQKLINEIDVEVQNELNEIDEVKQIETDAE